MAATAAARRPRDRKEQIVGAAADLFARHGFGAVSIDEIGAAVGVTGPAIYRHFRSKDALLAAVLARSVDVVGSATDSAFAERDGSLDAVLQATIGAVLAHPELMAAYVRERPSLTPDAAAALEPLERASSRRWADAIRRDRPDLGRARIAVRQGAVVGAVSAAALARRDLTDAALAALLADSTLAVLLAEPRPPDEVAAPGWSVRETRRQTILRVALGLFETRGYGGVGIDEIGEAAGTSGPAIYRQYASKAAILVDAFEEAGQRVAVAVDDALREASSAADGLDRLSRSYAAVALDNTALITVTEREALSLPEREQPRIERRARAIRDGWAAAVGELRPDLAEAEVRTLVRTVFSLINAAARAAHGQRSEAEEVAGIARAWVLGSEVNDR
ncbi:TetR/AcrR family transcriptional regulator [soil metagenome]